MATLAPKHIITHSQRVCRLYKKALKTVFNWYGTDRVEVRYQSVLLRERFEQTRSEKDMRKLAAMVEVGEEEVFKWTHPQPFIYKNDPEGITYERGSNPTDKVLDQWHPWEKVQFADYFSLREKRKDEYEKYYENSILAKGEKGIKDIKFPEAYPSDWNLKKTDA